MATRDRYTKSVGCKNCGAKGSLHISENDYDFMRKLNRDVDKVEGDFFVKTGIEGNIEVTCKKCGNIFFVLG